MLILTRRAGETVMIGSDVTITVLGVKGNQVRIGINAPKDSSCASGRDLRANSERKERRAEATPMKNKPSDSIFRSLATSRLYLVLPRRDLSG